MAEAKSTPTLKGRATVATPLDGEREALPLVELRARMVEARDEAAKLLADVLVLVPELEAELRTLDASLAGLEDRLEGLARKNQNMEMETRTAVRAAELRDRLSASLDKVRRAAASRPSEPIPVERLAPGFALSVSGPGTPGVRNARSVARRMIERIESKERR